MDNKSTMLATVIFAMGITLQGWAANPCLPIAEACMQEGYYKGGNKVGKGLVENCVMPVVANTKTLPNATFSNAIRQQCKAMLAEKMKGKR